MSFGGISCAVRNWKIRLGWKTAKHEETCCMACFTPCFSFLDVCFFQKHVREENQDGMAHRSRKTPLELWYVTLLVFSRFLQFLMNNLKTWFSLYPSGPAVTFCRFSWFWGKYMWTCGQFYSRSCLKHVNFYNMHVPNSPPCSFCVCFCPCLKSISSSMQYTSVYFSLSPDLTRCGFVTRVYFHSSIPIDLFRMLTFIFHI